MGKSDSYSRIKGVFHDILTFVRDKTPVSCHGFPPHPASVSHPATASGYFLGLV